LKIPVKIIARDESLDGNTITFGFPDENGQTITLPFDPLDTDAESLPIGLQGTIAIVPIDPDTPVNHPTVMDLDAAEGMLAAGASDIAAAVAPVVIPDAGTSGQ
jgi:hypothetical protein